MSFLKNLSYIKHNKATPGILLFFITIATLVFANSSFANVYHQFVYQKISLGFSDFELTKPLEIWVNEGLMAVFFFHIGLEIKKENIDGVLKTAKQILVPGVAAIGGMLLPAIIYTLIVPKQYLSGWAIPTATDIAFSLAICSLLSKKVPNSFRMMLMSIAIFDDLGAVIIIALFYSSGLSLLALSFSGLLTALLYILNKLNCRFVFIYLIFGFLLWLSVVKSGVHATLAGFILALMLPNDKINKIEKLVHPWVSYFIMPFFAIVNAGVNFENVSLHTITQPVTLGIILGLALGKPMGVFLALKSFKSHNFCNKKIMALGCLCGVGFTMSLFIGTLAFESVQALVWIKLGVLLGSLIMGLLGFLLLYQSYGANNENS